MAPVIPGLSAFEPIGRGGSAHVYSATRDAFGDRVAVKVLTEELTDSAAQRQFEKESESLRQLADVPGVVAILDLGVSEAGEPYLVMPLLEGGSSTSLIKQGTPMPWPEAAELIATASEAVDAAHQRGIWHRDIKPGNILLTARGRPFVADFGIAKLLSDSGNTTGASSFTPRYAAPEVLSGGHVAQSDVYSLAATFVAFVSGKAPFSESDGSVMAVINEVLHADPPDVTEFGVPQPVAGLMVRAMSKEPAGRPETPGAFAAELRSLMGEHAPAAALAPAPAPAPVQPLTVAEISRNAAAEEAVALPLQPQPSAAGGSRRSVLLALGSIAVLGLATIGWFALRGDDTGGVDTVAQSTAASASGASADTVSDVALAAAQEEADKAEADAADPSIVPDDKEDAEAADPSIVPDDKEDAEAADPGVLPPDLSIVTVEVDGSGMAATLAEAVQMVEPYGHVTLGPGTHVVTESVALSNPVTIAGQGASEVTVIAADTGAALDLRADRITIADLTITSNSDVDADAAAAPLVHVQNATDFTLHNVTVTGAQSFGLATSGLSTGTVASSVFLDNGAGGVHFGDQADVTLTGSQAMANSGSGFLWSGQSVGVVNGNTAGGNRSDGFTVRDGAQPVLVNNTAQENGADGFSWIDDSTGIATGNAATNNRAEGFSAYNTAHPTWTSNSATNNVGLGFFEGPESGATLDDGQVFVINADGSGDLPDLSTAIAKSGDGAVIRLGPGVHLVDPGQKIKKAIIIDGVGPSQTIITSTSLPALTLTAGATISDVTVSSAELDDATQPVVLVQEATDFALVATEVGKHTGPAVRVTGESLGSIVATSAMTTGDVSLDISDLSSVTVLGS